MRYTQTRAGTKVRKLHNFQRTFVGGLPLQSFVTKEKITLFNEAITYVRDVPTVVGSGQGQPPLTQLKMTTTSY